MARISKGKFRYLRDLFGYNDFVMWEDTETGICTGYHRGKVFHNMYPVSCVNEPFDVTGANVTINYQFEV